MIVLVYHERLGDVLRCLPIARHLAALGHEVAIECLPQYWSVFEAVSYARATSPGRDLKARRIDLQIWPDKYLAYRASGKSWEDFVYGMIPECAGMDRTIVFDKISSTSAVEDHLYGAKTAICSPFGYSQTVKIAPHLICQHAFQTFGAPMRILADERQTEACVASGWSESLFITARGVPDLIRILRDAREVMTVNSAPAIICNAVRDSYWHISSGTPQDDLVSSKAKLVTFEPIV